MLVPKVESDTKYLYYALKAIEIPAAGYSRHYKFLKETQIPFPPLDEQKWIAGILDAADALRAKRREALAELDTLVQSTFLDMFGDPVTNPMGWGVVAFESIGKKQAGEDARQGEGSGRLPVSLPCEHQRSMGQVRLGSASHYGTFQNLIAKSSNSRMAIS